MAIVSTRTYRALPLNADPRIAAGEAARQRALDLQRKAIARGRSRENIIGMRFQHSMKQRITSAK